MITITFGVQKLARCYLEVLYLFEGVATKQPCRQIRRTQAATKILVSHSGEKLRDAGVSLGPSFCGCEKYWTLQACKVTRLRSEHPSTRTSIGSWESGSRRCSRGASYTPGQVVQIRDAWQQIRGAAQCRQVLNRKVGAPEARLSDLTWMSWQEGEGKRAKGDGQ